jgi:hypothetical protein
MSYHELVICIHSSNHPNNHTLKTKEYLLFNYWQGKNN